MDALTTVPPKDITAISEVPPPISTIMFPQGLEISIPAPIAAAIGSSIMETSLAPEELLNHTQRIELQQGRVRKAERWGPRTLDLDIMLFGNEVINTERLTVPHYDMKNRGFMLWPLFEIAPELVFPDGETLREILHARKFSKLNQW